LRREHRLTPAGLPDSSARSSDHSVSSHQRDDRGSPGCQRICPRLDRLRHSVEGSPVHADRIEFTTAPASGTCVTDWSFSLRCSPPRITATQLRLNTPRLFAAGERTLTAPTQHHLRRTTADRPGPQRLIRCKDSRILRTPSTERRAAGGDRTRSGGSVKMRSPTRLWMESEMRVYIPFIASTRDNISALPLSFSDLQITPTNHLTPPARAPCSPT